MALLRNYADGYELFDTDYDQAQLAAQEVGVVSGCACSADGIDMVVDYAAGVVKTGLSVSEIAAGSVDLTSLQSTTNPCKALIYVDASDSNAVKAIAGTPSAAYPRSFTGRKTVTPAPPDYGNISTDDVVLAEVWVPATGVIASTCVTDRRWMIVPNLLTIPADYAVFQIGSTYYAKSMATGLTPYSGTTYETVYASALAALTGGDGVIIDMTDGMGPGPTINHYFDSVLSDPRFHTQMRYVPPLNIISCFDGGIGVEWTNEAGTSVDDLVNFKRGTKSIKMTANNPRTHRIKKVGPWDFSDMDYFFFRTHSPQQSLLTTGLLYFNTAAGDYYSAWVGPKLTTWPATEQWFEWNCARFQFSKTGNADWSNIQYIMFDAYCLGGSSNVDMTMDMLAYCKNPSPRGSVSIWLDDSGNTSLDYMKPYLDKYGYKMSILYYTTAGTYVNVLQTMKKEGHEIACHGYSHDNWAEMTENEWTTEIVKWFRHADKYGLLGQHHIAGPPGGATTYNVTQWCEKYFTLTRNGGSSGYDTWPFASAVTGRGSQIDTMSLATAQSNIDTVAANRFHWNIILHGVGPSVAIWKADVFEDLLDYIYSKGVDVKTYSQLLAEGIPRTSAYIPMVVD